MSRDKLNLRPEEARELESTAGRLRFLWWRVKVTLYAWRKFGQWYPYGFSDWALDREAYLDGMHVSEYVEEAWFRE